ncbi:MAG: putative polysaccharide transport protein [Gemmatimonadetes bacterium]|nr:putative polysaccharide transport protein [Gemmatimonadota bacterium]
MTTEAARPTGRLHLADGVVRGFAAELLLLPTGLVTAAVLTRVLGPAGYGLFSLAATLITWLTMTTTAVLARAAVKFVSEAEEWEPVAASVLRWRLAIGLVAAPLLLAGAGLIARVLHQPELTPYLRVFAADLLLTNLARAYREVLTGRGRYREVAIVSSARWLSRMVLIVVLVEATGSVMGAVAGSVGATLVELIVAQWLQPISLEGRSGVRPAAMWGLAAPLMVYGAAMQLFSKVDLFALSALGGSASDAGYYGAAQNLAVAPGLFALALGPLLLATLVRLRRAGHDDEARVVGRSALRVTFALIPFAALVGGAAPEIVRVIFGPSFAPAAPLLALLFAAAVAIATMAVTVAIITAIDHPRVVSVIGVSVLALAIGGHVLLIPRLGATGAALVTAGTAAVGALVSVALVHRAWHVHAYATLVRAASIGVPAYWVSSAFATQRPLALVLKMSLLSILVIGAFLALGELEPAERRQWWALRPRWRTAREGPG